MNRLRRLARFLLFGALLAAGASAGAGDTERGKVDWTGGAVTGIGQGTARPSGNRVADRIQALRAAEVMAQRALAETIHGVRVDAVTTVGKLEKETVVQSRVEGVVRGARKVRAEVTWEGDVPMATVELRICLSEDAPGCGGSATLVSALADPSRPEPTFVPAVYYEGGGTPEPAEPPQPAPPGEVARPAEVRFDPSRPVTGLILDLRGVRFERELFPVVITRGEDGKRVTVYSAKVVRPEVVRTLGVARFTETVDDAMRIGRAGDNPAIVPVSEVTKENLLVLRTEAAKTVRETTRYGNDYLAEAKVVISGR